MKLIVGAYASAPSNNTWNKEEESNYYDALKSNDAIDGLEIPFTSKLHSFDEQWYLSMLSARWTYVLTCIPGTMMALNQDASFGLASNQAAGREKAMQFYKGAAEAIATINKQLKKQAVTHVLIHTAPSNPQYRCDKALEKSLLELCSYDWHGAKLLIEHCDAWQPENPFEKGFMDLESELAIVSKVNQESKCGIAFSLNWGRSAIEFQSKLGAIEHIKACNAKQLLNGFIFSGASASSDIYGKWRDSHMPPSLESLEDPTLEDSELDTQAIKVSINELNSSSLDFIGCKISLLPTSRATEEKIKCIHDTVAVIKNVLENRI